MYIRTKNRIYKTESAFLDNNGKWVGYNIVEDDMAVILRCQVTREADTIEELCDEFVCEWFDKEVNRNRHKYCSFKIGQSKELYRRDIPLSANVDFEIYAGIWVQDKGLIYVAKMNENGELELI